MGIKILPLLSSNPQKYLTGVAAVNLLNHGFVLLWLGVQIESGCQMNISCKAPPFHIFLLTIVPY